LRGSDPDANSHGANGPAVDIITTKVMSLLSNGAQRG